jgi:hypothetical protein
MAMDGVAEACAWCVGLTLLSAGLIKLGRPSRFIAELADYELLPRWLTGPAGVLIIVLELAAGCAAIMPTTRPAGCLVAIALLAAFAFAVIVNLVRGRTDIACACFGRSSQRLSWRLPVRNGALAAMAAVGIGGADSLLPTVAGVVVVGLALLCVWLTLEYVDLMSLKEASQ